MARRALGPATLAVRQAVEAALAPADVALVVACSGGPDSLALAAGTQLVAARRGLPYAAVVVEHGLQAATVAVAAQTRQTLLGLGYGDVEVVGVAVADDGSGPEGSARASRLAALARAAAERGATVLLGHTLDDQAETVLLGLARGSGTRSLAGMAARRDGWLRPLLGLRRTTTVQACVELGLEPWTDPHNSDPGYARVRVRTQALPVLEAALGPGVAEALARTAALARGDADLLDALAAAADPGTDTLGCADLLGVPAALRTRVLRRWLARHGVADLSAGHVGAVETLVLGWRGQRGVDLPGVRVVRLAGRLHVRPG